MACSCAISIIDGSDIELKLILFDDLILFNNDIINNILLINIWSKLNKFT